MQIEDEKPNSNLLCDTRMEPRLDDMIVLKKARNAFFVSTRATLSSVPVTGLEMTLDT